MKALFVLLFTALGAGAGLTHGAALACAACSRRPRLDLLCIRLTVVAAALTAAAVYGQLLNTSLAWLGTFCLTLFALHAPGRDPR